jgi:hypothetical protein
MDIAQPRQGCEATSRRQRRGKAFLQPLPQMLSRQLVPMVDQHVQAQILNSLANQVRGDGDDTS